MTIDTPFGREMQALARHVASKSAGAKFLGYMIDQKERLLGLRGQKDVNRPELVAKFGFDTKYAGHVIRLGLQGIELLKTGWITLPMPEVERQMVVGIRNGCMALDKVVELAEGLEDELRAWLDRSPLPSSPDTKAVNQWLVDVYPRYWSAHSAWPSAVHSRVGVRGSRA